jgi:hypothetical protein
MKRWTLREMVRTDIFRRGVPWMLLIQRTGTVETDLNVKSTQKLCVALTGLALIAACGVAVPRADVAAAAGLTSVACLAGIVALNRSFFAFLARRMGWRFACAALPLQLVYYGCCGVSVVIAMAHWQLGRLRGASARRDHSAVPAPHLVGSRSTGQRVSRRDTQRTAELRGENQETDERLA